MTTKFEKVRVRRAPDPDRVLYPSTPRPSETTAEHVADRRLGHSRYLPARSSTPSARARRCSPMPCASCSTARESTPTRPLRTYVARPAPPPASPRALPHANQISRGTIRIWVPRNDSGEAKTLFRRPVRSIRVSRKSNLAPPLLLSARHGGRRLHRRDDGAARRALSARGDLDASLRESEEEKRKSAS